MKRPVATKPWRATLAWSLAAVALLVVPHPASAQSQAPSSEIPIDGGALCGIAGIVVDKTTELPIPYARITLEASSPIEIITKSDGTFQSRALICRPYEITVTRLGYVTLTETLEVTASAMDALATLRFALDPRAVPTPGIEVTTTKVVDRGSAVAFTELDSTAMRERYWAQDVPMLLAETPGVYAYSDAGNGVGYSYVKVRGFAQRRVAVTINGIPLNDPESHEVYWVDHPDLVTSAQSLQVQRGVGSALYGSSAVGGSINLETLTTPGDPSISLEAGVGTFDTQRYAVQYNSGLLNDAYSISGRLSRISSDGYREQSWTSLWS
ncbi:MAG: TonB-dependent receptor plug domain-containing protein, partial [Candidatus Eiseniibacteriota bacterium]